MSETLIEQNSEDLTPFKEPGPCLSAGPKPVLEGRRVGSSPLWLVIYRRGGLIPPIEPDLGSPSAVGCLVGSSQLLKIAVITPNSSAPLSKLGVGLLENYSFIDPVS